MPPTRLRTLTAAVAAAIAVLGACGDDKTGDAAAFCADLQADAPAIMNPQVTTDAEIDAHLRTYRALAETVPLAIEEDWDVLLGAFEAANAVEPGDAEATEEARRAIYAAEPSALAVRDWVTVNCGFDLGAVGPIATVGAPTTTVAVTAPD